MIPTCRRLKSALVELPPAVPHSCGICDYDNDHHGHAAHQLPIVAAHLLVHLCCCRAELDTLTLELPSLLDQKLDLRMPPQQLVNDVDNIVTDAPSPFKHHRHLVRASTI